jgi:hypothetical protein
MRHLTRAGLSALATAALLTPMTAAEAADRSFSDPAGDSGRATDISRVDVSYSKKRLRVTARYPGSDLQGSNVRYWLDTDKDRRPDVFVHIIPNSDGLFLMEVNGFNKPFSGDPIPCRGFRAWADIFDSRGKRTWVKIPSRCLGDPGKVRVAVQTKRGKASDWVRDVKTFLPGVKRG